MTKQEFVDRLAKTGNITKKQAAEALDMIFNQIKTELAKGEQISIPGFGKFSVAKRPARTGVNPRTKAKIEIKATNAPKFTAAKALKDAVNAS